MSTKPTPENISGPNRIEGSQPLGEELHATPESSFQSYMQKQPETWSQPQPPGAMDTKSVSPFDLAHGHTVLPVAPTPQTLLAQAKTVHTALGDVATRLATPKLKLKQAHKYALRNKLTAASARLRSANALMGVQPPKEAPETPAAGGPIHKFLNFVTDGQNQLDSAIKQLSDLKDKKTSLNPGDFLLIQLRLSKAQQEIEYSSVLLGKAIDDMKTLMQIQL